MDYLSTLTIKAIGKIQSNIIKCDDGFDIINKDLKNAIDEVFNKYNLEYERLEIMSHDLNIEHIVQCDICKVWLINRTEETSREDVDEIIKNGAEYQNKILCSDCLPLTHKWSWKNT